MSGNTILDKEQEMPVHASPRVPYAVAVHDDRPQHWTGPTLNRRFSYHCDRCGMGFPHAEQATTCCTEKPSEYDDDLQTIYDMRKRGATAYEIRDALSMGGMTSISRLIQIVDMRLRTELGLCNADSFSRWRIKQRAGATQQNKPQLSEQAKARKRAKQLVVSLEALGYMPSEIQRKTGISQLEVDRYCYHARMERMMALGLHSRHDYAAWRDGQRKANGIRKITHGGF